MAGSIPEDFIREIVDTTNIVSLVEGYLPLKKKGKDHWGICCLLYTTDAADEG